MTNLVIKEMIRNLDYSQIDLYYFNIPVNPYYLISFISLPSFIRWNAPYIFLFCSVYL